MTNSSDSRNLTWHFVFWLSYLVIRIFIIELYPGDLLYRVSAELIEVPLKMAALYFAIYILIRKLLLTKRYGWFAVGCIAYVIAVMFLNRMEDYYIIYPLTGSETTKYAMGFWSVKAAFLNLIYIYPVVGLGVAVYFVKSWYDNQLNQERLMREKAQAEMKLLKDQLHPHFLFNTLNNIYSLAQIKHDNVPDLMLRLSKLLSFMLYDCSVSYISLSKEIQALKDYIELERLRLGHRLEINFQTNGDIEAKQIAPLLLFPLVENCFKHGSHKTAEKVWISFNLTVSGYELLAQIENTLPLESSTNQATGIGIENLKKRLELLYGNRYELSIHKTETYLVKLKLMLS